MMYAKWGRGRAKSFVYNRKYVLLSFDDLKVNSMSSGFDFIVDNLSRTLRRSKKLKLELDDQSMELLNELVQGQPYEIEELAARLLSQAIREYYQTTDENVRLWETLSERQRQVAALVCLKYTNDEIAEKLHISSDTVKTHVSNILRKFKVRGRHQLAHILQKWDFSSFDT
jgi:DNA-binding NarL/FixJ family response regulator